MDPVTTSLFQQGGPYAVIGGLLVAVGVLWRKAEALQQSRLDDKDKQLDAAEQTFTAVTSALETVKATIEALQQSRPRGRQ